ncbi:MAG: NADPH-dependent F420 reductase [Mycobacterium sp.]
MMSNVIPQSNPMIAVIGAGNIGGTLARRWAATGLAVRLANSRGPQSLADVVAGTPIRACSLDDVAVDAEVVVVSVPFGRVATLRDTLSRLPRHVPVIDTGNYVPVVRDDSVQAIDAGLTESVWVAELLDRTLVKAFNTIGAASLRAKASAGHEPVRVAAPVAADLAEHRLIANLLVDAAGFQPIEGGTIAQSWRQQPGTPVYTTDLDPAAARAALEAARPEQTVAWRARVAANQATAGE